MKEVVKFDPRRLDSWLDHAVLNAISSMSGSQTEEFLKNIGWGRNYTMTISLLFDGHETPFPASKFFDNVEKQLESMIRAEAERIFKEQMQDRIRTLADKLAEMETSADVLLSTIRTDIGWE